MNAIIQQNIEIYASRYRDFYRHVWLVIHLLTFKYSCSDKEHFCLMLKSVADYLPCKTCATKWLEIHFNKIDFNNKNTLIRSLVDIHNDINGDKNKPVLTFDEFNSQFNPRKVQEHLCSLNIDIDDHNSPDFIRNTFKTLNNVFKYP